MKFDSALYEKVYHAETAEGQTAGSDGGVVEPQPKQDAKQEQNVQPKQGNDININVNVSTSGEAGEADEAGEAGEETDTTSEEAAGSEGE